MSTWTGSVGKSRFCIQLRCKSPCKSLGTVPDGVRQTLANVGRHAVLSRRISNRRWPFQKLIYCGPPLRTCAASPCMTVHDRMRYMLDTFSASSSAWLPSQYAHSTTASSSHHLAEDQSPAVGHAHKNQLTHEWNEFLPEQTCRHAGCTSRLTCGTLHLMSLERHGLRLMIGRMKTAACHGTGHSRLPFQNSHSMHAICVHVLSVMFESSVT